MKRVEHPRIMCGLRVARSRCMYMCAHMHSDVYVHAYIYIYTYIRMHVHVHFTWTHIHTCIYVFNACKLLFEYRHMYVYTLNVYKNARLGTCLRLRARASRPN